MNDPINEFLNILLQRDVKREDISIVSFPKSENYRFKINRNGQSSYLEFSPIGAFNKRRKIIQLLNAIADWYHWEGALDDEPPGGYIK